MATRRPSPRSRIARLGFPIRGRRVDLVLPALSDIPAFLRLLNEPSVARWTLHVPYPYTKPTLATGPGSLGRVGRPRESLGLTVVRRSDGELLGGVGLHDLKEGDPCAEVGYWMAESTGAMATRPRR